MRTPTVSCRFARKSVIALTLEPAAIDFALRYCNGKFQPAFGHSRFKCAVDAAAAGKSETRTLKTAH